MELVSIPVIVRDTATCFFHPATNEGRNRTVTISVEVSKRFLGFWAQEWVINRRCDRRKRWRRRKLLWNLVKGHVQPAVDIQVFVDVVVGKSCCRVTLLWQLQVVHRRVVITVCVCTAIDPRTEAEWASEDRLTTTEFVAG